MRPRTFKLALIALVPYVLALPVAHQKHKRMIGGEALDHGFAEYANAIQHGHTPSPHPHGQSFHDILPPIEDPHISMGQEGLWEVGSNGRPRLIREHTSHAQHMRPHQLDMTGVTVTRAAPSHHVDPQFNNIHLRKRKRGLGDAGLEDLARSSGGFLREGHGETLGDLAHAAEQRPHVHDGYTHRHSLDLEQHAGSFHPGGVMQPNTLHLHGPNGGMRVVHGPVPVPERHPHMNGHAPESGRFE